MVVSKVEPQAQGLREERMIIWGALGIPLLVALVLYVFYDRKTVWWEPLVPIAVSLALIGSCKGLINVSEVRDVEYIGGWITHVEHHQPWNEKVGCRHNKPCTHRDSDGNKRHFSDGKRHSFDVDDHPAAWYAHDSNGRKFSISQQTFETTTNNFDNKKFIELNRTFYTVDGDKEESRWLGIDVTQVPTTVVQPYTNRVQSSAEFTFPEVDPKTHGLFDYPEIRNGYECPSIMGDGGTTRSAADIILQRANAKLGAAKQVRLWILVFKEKPIEAGLDQEAYWKGGNKNEFVITIGTDANNVVRWSHVFSWTEEQGLKSDLNELIENSGTLDLVRVVEWLEPQIATRFVRKSFSDFNYLTVEPPLGSVIATYVLTLLVNIFFSFWIVGNDVTE